MRVAVLGLGFMGSTHLKALRAIPAAELAAVYSGDPLKLSGDLSAVQGNIGGPGERFDFSAVSKYSTIDALLADPTVEAVDVCLPTDLHAPVSVQALQSGKHVLVEKPMALDTAECTGMLQASARRSKVLMVAQVLRFFPAYRALIHIVASAELGPIRSALFRRRCAAPARRRWLSDPLRSGGGVFDLLIHDVDMCLHLFGMPRAVSATGYVAIETGIDLIAATLHYDDRFAATITGGWHHPESHPFSMEYTVVADGGTVEYSSLGTPPTLYRAHGGSELLSLTGEDGYAAELRYFIDCCRTGTPPALCPPVESAEAVALMLLLLEARNRKEEIIPCNL